MSHKPKHNYKKSISQGHPVESVLYIRSLTPSKYHRSITWRPSLQVGLTTSPAFFTFWEDHHSPREGSEWVTGQLGYDDTLILYPSPTS